MVILFMVSIWVFAMPVYADVLPLKPRQTTQSQSSSQSVKMLAQQLQKYLANQQYHRISEHIHPTRGVRFSMYAYVDLKKDKVFSRNDFDTYLEQSKIRFTWGVKDGSGHLLIETLPKYLNDWVRAKSFNNHTVISVNQFRSEGSSLNNLLKAYPNHEFVEFYYKGSVQRDGFDWRVLRLVFDAYQGGPYLVAIITDEWTS